MTVYCPNTTEFERRTEKRREGDLPVYRCTSCGRVSRTTRQHQVPGKTTASHDKTMAFVWDIAS